MSNLQLWNTVEKTDPSHTKSFTKGGGFSGTAINAVYLARRATETFGPIGIGWGVEVISDDYIDGAPLVVDGQVVGREVVHKVLVRLWYVLDGKRGEVQHYGLTTVVGRNKNGFFTDEDHAKKSLTDATTKALSLLGFAADVHLGKYDDNKYVNDLRREFAAGSDQNGQQGVDKGWERRRNAIQRDIDAAADDVALRKVFKALNEAERAAMMDAFTERAAQLKQKAAA